LDNRWIDLRARQLLIYNRKLVMAWSGGSLILFDRADEGNALSDFRHAVCDVGFLTFALRREHQFERDGAPDFGC